MNRMSGDAIGALVAALADVVIEGNRGKAALIMAQLAELNGPGWLRLDELARRPCWSSRQSPLDDVAACEPVLTAGTSVAGLVGAPLCRAGRGRGAAGETRGPAPRPAAGRRLCGLGAR